MRRSALLAGVALLLTGCQSPFTTVGSWTRLATIPAVLSATTASPLADGRIAVIGGFNLNTGLPLGQNLLFDPTANRWSEEAPLPEPRSGYAVVALADDTVLVAGGMSGGLSAGPSQALTSTWIFNPQRDAWRRAGDLKAALLDPSAIRLDDGRVLLVGTSAHQTDSEIFDPASDAWSPASALNTARRSMALVALPHAMALTAGGCAAQSAPGQPSEPLSSAELFDSSSSRWVVTAPLPSARCGAKGLLLGDGRALVVGGAVNGPNGSIPVLNATLFNPQTRSWAAAGSAAGAGATGVLLHDGRVFMPAEEQGPQQGNVGTTLVGGQIYDPVDNSWRFVTTNSVRITRAFSFGFGAADQPLTLALPSGKAVVLLESASLLFDPQGSPPPGQALDNPFLTAALLGAGGVLALLLALAFLYQRRSRGSQPLP